MSELRKKMIRVMELKDFSPRTQESYIAAVAALAKFYKKSPELLSQEEIEDYLIHLKKIGRSPSTRGVVISALRFFYNQTLSDSSITLELPKRKRPKYLPEVLSRSEVTTLIESTNNIKHRVILMTAYSAGLRVSEIARLKPVHIDSSRMVIRVDQGKGKKDRYTILSQRLLEELRTYWKAYRPGKWLFYTKNRDTHISVPTIQRTYTKAKRAAGITKGRGIHTLRHCFATHLLEAGYDVRKIQLLMGHRSLETTLVYLHVSKKNLAMVKSPLDFIDATDELTAPWEDHHEK